MEKICTKLNGLNIYDPTAVADILKIEDCNFDRAENQQQLYGLAVSAKRYVVYAKEKDKTRIIKPSEHGLGIVFVPDKRKRYKPDDCKDQQNDYARWIVEAWERLLSEHFRNIKDPDNALVSHELWFDNLPAIMRVRVTTPNVMRALRKRDPGSAKPYNFAHSPILVDPPPHCTLIAPASKKPTEWLTRDYTEIHTGDKVNLGREYDGTGGRSRTAGQYPSRTSSGGIISTRKTNPFLQMASPVKRTRAECFYVAQFGRSYLLITSGRKSNAEPRKVKMWAFSNILDPNGMVHVTRLRLALPTRDLLRRLDNTVFGSSCGNQARRNTLPSGFYVANAYIQARARG